MRKQTTKPTKAVRRSGGPRLRAQDLDLQVPAWSTEILVRRNDDGTLSVLNLNDSRKFYKLNGLAAEIWSLIDGKRTVGKIKGRIIRKYDPPRKRFDADVSNFMKNLKKRKLLEFV